MVSSDNPSCQADYWLTVFLTKALFSQAWHGIHQRPRSVLKAGVAILFGMAIAVRL